MPAVTVPPSPNGLPMASTQSPTRRLSESPNGTAVSCVSPGSIFSTAISVFWSWPSTSATNVVSSASVTVISSAFSITWKFVTTMPASSMMNPDPSDEARRWRLSSPKLRKKSSNGEPGGNCGISADGPSLTMVVVEIFTTAGDSASAWSAKLSGRSAALISRVTNMIAAPASAGSGRSNRISIDSDLL